MTTFADDPLLRRTIAGKYVITSFIGEGAMGSVYRARHVALDTPVAIKVLKEHSRSESFAERFSREARAASRLDHPNSVRVMDYGEEPDGLLYLVMELLDGRELAALIDAEFPLATERVVGILGQALAAIAVAHDMGVIHRDLKPENIMILLRADDDGAPMDVVKVCDFGIAKLQHAEPTPGRRLTTQGEVIGTPEFMSPEQARGEELDARSDLYSMGVILFEMLCGRPPFESDTALGLALKHITDPPPPPSHLQPQVDRELERICLKAMSKRREDRYQSAREMRSDLRAVLPGSPRTGQHRAADSLLERDRGTSSSRAEVARGAETVTTTVVASSTPSVAQGASPSPQRRKRSIFPIAVVALLLAGGGLVFARLTREPRGAALSPGPDVSPATEPSMMATTPAPTETAPVAPEPSGVVAPAITTTVKPTAAPMAVKTSATAATASPSAPVASLSVPPAIAPEPKPTAATAATVAVAAPTVAPTTAPTVAAAPPFDPSGGHAVISSATATNGVSGTSVRASLNVEGISRCYRDALKSKGAAASGGATLQLSIDDGGRVTAASLKGAEFLPSMKGCVEGVARLAKIKGVDTGDAAATVSLSFLLK